VDGNGWTEGFPGAITVCDLEGTILAMNNASAAVFAEDGGRALVGGSLYDCHPEPARTKLREMLETGRSNVYTIEKRGRRKLIYQAPWFRDGVRAGLVELALELPAELPHFIREG
jgi:hypothetical protein